MPHPESHQLLEMYKRKQSLQIIILNLCFEGRFVYTLCYNKIIWCDYIIFFHYCIYLYVVCIKGIHLFISISFESWMTEGDRGMLNNQKVMVMMGIWKTPCNHEYSVFLSNMHTWSLSSACHPHLLPMSLPCPLMYCNAKRNARMTARRRTNDEIINRFVIQLTTFLLYRYYPENVYRNINT